MVAVDVTWCRFDGNFRMLGCGGTHIFCVKALPAALGILAKGAYSAFKRQIGIPECNAANLTVMIKAARLAGRSLAKDFREVENLQVSSKSAGDFNARRYCS